MNNSDNPKLCAEQKKRPTESERRRAQRRELKQIVRNLAKHHTVYL